LIEVGTPTGGGGGGGGELGQDQFWDGGRREEMTGLYGSVLGPRRRAE